MATDREVFKDLKPVEKKVINPEGGRPKYNRDLGFQMIKAGLSSRRIIKELGCSRQTVKRMREELAESGVEVKPITDEDLTALEISNREFDAECTLAMGFSFKDWLVSRTSRAKTIFNFTQRCWKQIWGHVSILMMKDRDMTTGDDMAIRFLKIFGNDIVRLRYRKKQVRYIFRFLGRQDVCDRHLTMTRSREPVRVRELPEIGFTDFPTKLGNAIRDIEENEGSEIAAAIRFKICTQMRTGNRKAQRELMGIVVNDTTKDSYVVIQDAVNWSMKVKGKGNEKWTINWLPESVLDDLIRMYNKREKGEYLVKINVRRILKIFKKYTLKHVGIEMKLHDLRKVSITWFWAMGVPLEIATTLNVGWRDLNTARDHYLTYRRLLKREQRRQYRANIPEWFKDGIDEFLDEKV